ncbi:MAG: hypothetical protein H0W29_18790, partial [Gemmatimonadales bacterium]|nr:hypothetical protein [Gemmatimonadales bacterium]
MNLEKLKDTARKFEQKEDWRRAIEVYLKAIQQIESGQETSPDLSLYNRVGDLYLKTSDTAAAVRSYERAVDLYADQGFFNNAIALCGKILRVNPGRTQTYLKLAQLHARKNVVIEAKRNLIEFLERMNALGQLDQAFGSVNEFADQFSGSQEIRLMLVELLRATSREDEAREQLEKLAGEIEGRGERLGQRPPQERTPSHQEEESAQRPPRPPPAGLVFLDTGVDLPLEPPPGSSELLEVSPPEGLQHSELGGPAGDAGMTDEPVDLVVGLEQATEVDLVATGMDTDLGLERMERAELEFIGEPLEGMDESPGDLVDEDLMASTDDSVVDYAMGEPESGPELELIEPELDQHAAEGVEPATALADLPLLPVEAGEDGMADLESRILEDPDN